MRQYVQTDLELHRQVATALAELILDGVMPAVDNPPPQRDAPDRAQGLVHNPCTPGDRSARSNCSEALNC